MFEVLCSLFFRPGVIVDVFVKNLAVREMGIQEYLRSDNR